MKLVLSIITLVLGASFCAQAHEQTTGELVKAFKNADENAMSKFFANEIEFAGDHKFLGLDKRIPKTVPVAAKDLTASYRRLFDLYGKEEWRKLAAKTKPTFVVSEEGKELKGFVNPGDVICDMHFKEAKGGKPSGFDEAVIFVFRKVSGEYKIVFHFADY